MATAAILLARVSVGAAADAVRTTSYAQWGPFTGSANNYATSFEVPVTGFPAASVTSDSRAGNVGIYSGATNWVGENTPIGLKYGSSRNQGYVALWPRVDNATGGSTTTYAFDRPTPPTGWAFALSDIDADQATLLLVRPGCHPARLHRQHRAAADLRGGCSTQPNGEHGCR